MNEFAKATAFGAPGIDHGWQHGSKMGVGTALTKASRVWFTLARGIVTECYFPRVDIANLRDLQFLVAGPDFVHDEQFDMQHQVAYVDPGALAYRLTNSDRQGRYRLIKEICVDPEGDALLISVQLEAPAAYRLYVLAAPRLGNQAEGNNARILARPDGPLLHAWRDQAHLAICSDAPWAAASCGYVGASDGWQDVKQHGSLNWRFSEALDGRVALIGQLAREADRPIRLALGFGSDQDAAEAAARHALSRPFADVMRAYVEGWREYCRELLPLGDARPDGGQQYRISAMVLRALEDKANPGACVASLAIPWGEAHKEREAGGYHLVWPRDLCKIGEAALAIGRVDLAQRILRYLAQTQAPDGHWSQNFWVDGRPYWHGLQFDETAYPIVLTYRLEQAGALDFDAWPLVVAAARFLLQRGPRTGQERWEENGGYSPSTLTVEIAALLSAAALADNRNKRALAAHLREVADSWTEHLEAWCFTESGGLAGSSAYYERIVELSCEDVASDAQLSRAEIPIHNLDPAQHPGYAPQSVIDGGFLNLVRFGLRRADDPHLLASIKAYDANLKVETPSGPSWHRYNHDGYGERADGSPFEGFGVGRAWPFLTGERGHYELARGRDPEPYLRAMEQFAGEGGMIPEQVWDGPDIPAKGLFLGRPTGSAAPLGWSHAEYVTLLRSARDGAVWPRLAICADRYLDPAPERSHLDLWTFGHPIRRTATGRALRIQAGAPFVLHYGIDGWQRVADAAAQEIAELNLWVVDLDDAQVGQAKTIEFTFYWPNAGRWEGQDFVVARTLAAPETPAACAQPA